MIKPEDLRIGDFVKVSSDHSMIPQGTICEVVGVSYERILTKKKRFAILLPLDRKEDEGARGIWLDNIEGIPFSIKFLTKNGFKKTEHRMDRSGYEWCTYENENSCVRVEYYPKTKDFSTFVGKEELCYITHVHELQNILSALKENVTITI